MSTVWTCQCCGRAIQARRGVIAHHGYRRPGDRHQTPSCFGARALPYELAKDRIEEAIRAYEFRAAENAARLAQHTTAPYPEKVVHYERRPWKQFERIEVARPDGFDPTSIEFRIDRQRFRSYATLWEAQTSEIEAQGRRIAETLIVLRERLAAWKAPADGMLAAWQAYAGKPAKTIRPEFA